ncbi:BCCT family transporter [Glycomyces buryatensis]|uniref:BCCT family transporter n=1 Tax=Glycomyces buryatensis TaxID=2570927 RepID=A0A4S8PTA4_9ACTN|nr:BCCT family transporter [Glycomyces buryatensis]THV34633.1 BCCT family transporter [Glycomyces buryatensis]
MTTTETAETPEPGEQLPEPGLLPIEDVRAQGDLRPPTLPVDRAVFWIAAAVILAVILWGAVLPEAFESASTSALNWVIANFGWLFIIAGNIFLVLAVYIASSRYGNIRLGAADEEPEFGTLPWISMMFAAGMGIGLMFYGVAEPLSHYFDAPPPLQLDPTSPYYQDELQQGALLYSFFHWGLHPWAIYAVAGLALAYSTFRKRRGNNLSDAFAPLTADRNWGHGAGRAIDLLAIFATVFGTAASLGLGALQVAVGLNITLGVPETRWLELIVIAALTLAFVVSAFSGVHRGVKWLSTTNVLLALFLVMFVFLVGPSLWILDAWPATTGAYLSSLVDISNITGAFGGADWMATWTIFYWAWWLSWAPFVGTFIARISRGRSIRQFVVGVLLVPSTASTLWFTILGGTAIRFQSTGAADYSAEVAQGPEYALFALLQSLPLYSLLAGISMLLVAIYFVTGADSASLVLGSLSSHGSLHPKKPLVVFWGMVIGAVAAVLLLSGGLQGLKNATIIVALPFVFVMLALCVALMKELVTDPGANPLRQQLRHKGFREAIRRLVGEEVSAHAENGNNRWYRGKRKFGMGSGRRSNHEE